jgi:hypothetical protein
VPPTPLRRPAAFGTVRGTRQRPGTRLEERIVIAARGSWKTIAAIATIVAELAVLGLVAFGAPAPVADGVIIRPGAASLDVREQTGDWGTLTVHRVVTPVASWVVVQARSGAAGGVGSVLGYTRVLAGTTTDVNVTLDPKQALINTFVVSLIADAGAPGVFEYWPPPRGGGGGGMMGGAPTGGDASSVTTTPTIDKPLIAGGKSVSVVVIETMRTGVPGSVTRTTQPQGARATAP